MKLFRKEIIGTKVRSRYDVSGEVEHYCKKLFSDSIFHLTQSALNLSQKK